eukprot:NODE_2018_length_1322_cov_36.725844_g1834_i0.p1 GENE.NODE_2018_length_1322_cov_36.725844_g1834_i0~~NODE_2018_length_1322_cov_36.725844_g1834_i0.p1  ORF type:complete len:357 (+),score=31.27 NODE_2018_length_1322_cov_36.725844_g1834_i0:130-1200(+)
MAGGVVIFVNPKSGGQMGPRVLQQLSDYIGAENVFDLSRGPAAGLTRCKLLLEANSSLPAGERVRVLVAGGDGTVGWILGDMIDKLGMVEEAIPIAVLPLGTGNDMARMLGWGGHYVRAPPEQVVSRVRNATPIEVDRWTVQYNDKIDSDIESPNGSTASSVMCNYFSIGNDALVALNFHQLRCNHPGWFKCRYLNFLWYGVSGAKAYFQRQSRLSAFLNLVVDGKSVAIPNNTCSLIILNINSYMAGADLWGRKGERAHCCCCSSCGRLQLEDAVESHPGDSLLEVVGMGSGPRQGMVKTFGCTGVRLAQGTDVCISVRSGAPFYTQIDGEPRGVTTNDVHISRTRGAVMLKAPF